jgi:hypothetical protein
MVAEKVKYGFADSYIVFVQQTHVTYSDFRFSDGLRSYPLLFV